MSGIPTLNAGPLTGAAAPSIVPYRPAGAEQLSQLGAAVQGFGQTVATEADRLQDQLDESSAMAGLRDFAERQRAILRDPNTGYLGTIGQNAVAQRGQALKALEEARREVAGTLGSQQAQALFARQADVRMSEAQWDIDGHAGREAREFDVQETSRAIDLYADEAVDWYGRSDPGGTIDVTYRQRRQSALDQFDRLASLRGVPQNSLTYQDLRRKVSGKIAAGVTQKLLAVDPDKAWAFLRDARKSGDIDDETDRSLSAAVQKQADVAVGQRRAIEALQSAGGRGWQAELLLADANLPPGVLREARREVGERSAAIEQGRAAASSEVLNRMTAWSIDNPSASWQEWEQEHPEEAVYARKNGLLDEVVEQFASEKRGADNPVTRAELESQGDDFWRTMTPQKFLVDYGTKLSAASRNRFLGKIQEAQPGAVKPIASEEDLNKLALGQNKGIVYWNNTMTSDSAQTLMALNAETDRIVQAMDPKMPAADRYRQARAQALLDYAPGSTAGSPKWRWQVRDEDRAKMNAVDAEGNEVDVRVAAASISVPEMAKVLQSIGSTLKPAELEAWGAKLRTQLQQEGQVDPRSLNRVLGQALQTAGLPPGTSPNTVVQAVIATRKQSIANRDQERAANPGIVSIERLARARGETVESVRQRLSARTIDVPDDDLAYGTEQEFVFGKDRDRLVESGQIVGISRAAAERILPGLVEARGEQAAAALQSTAAAQDRVAWLESLQAQQDPERVAEIQAARDRYQAELDQIDDDEQGSPYATNLRTQVSMLDAHVRRLTPDVAQVDAAWEAWLQLGGEVYEAQTEMGMALRALTPKVPVPEQFRQFQIYGRDDIYRDRIQRHLDAVRPRYASMPSLEQHRAMRKLVEQLRGGAR